MPEIPTTVIAVDLGFPYLIARAQYAVQRCLKDENAGCDAVLYAAFAIEAFPNDFEFIASKYSVETDFPPIIKAAAEILKDLERERASSAIKYQLLHLTLTGSPLDKGKNPYQDFSYLTYLRNEIAHHKVEEFPLNVGLESASDRLKRIVKNLRDRGIFKNSLGAANADWKNLLDGPDGAKWSVKTAWSMLEEVYRIVPDCRMKRDYLGQVLSKKINFDDMGSGNKEKF